MNWASEAVARGYELHSCEHCHGAGECAYSHPERRETCLFCDGTGSTVAECPCGNEGPSMLVEGVLMCPKCAASCQQCGGDTSVVADRNTGDELCLGCFERQASEDLELRKTA